MDYLLSKLFFVFFVCTKSGCRKSLVYHSFHLVSTLSFSVFHSVRAESTKTTWQLLPEDRYNRENNLAGCTKTKTQFDGARPNRHGLDLILDTIVIFVSNVAVTVRETKMSVSQDVSAAVPLVAYTMNIAWIYRENSSSYLSIVKISNFFSLESYILFASFIFLYVSLNLHLQARCSSVTIHYDLSFDLSIVL